MTDPNHFLIAVGMSEYDRLDAEEQLPSADEDVRIVTELLCTELGYDRVLHDLAVSPSAASARDRLSAWLADGDRKEDDRVIIYWSGHGEFGADGRHYLLCRDFDGTNYISKALATEDIGRMLAGTCVQNVLLLVDACFAGAGIFELSGMQGEIEMSRPEMSEMAAGIHLVAASRPREAANVGLFSRMFVDAVNRQRHGGWRQPALDPVSVVRAINERMGAEKTGQQVLINVIGSGGGISPVLPNPRYDERLPDGTAIEEGRRLLKRPDLLAHWSPRARGVGLHSEVGDHFEGRHAALRSLVDWLDDETATGQRVVTGGPGSGKSALLARIALLSDAEYRATLAIDRADPKTLPAVGAVDIAVHARGKAVADVTAEVADALDTEPVVALIAEAASARPRPPVMLVDALDEALDPRGVARELLRPLADGAKVKLIIGTRKHIIRSLGAADQEVMDLDDRSRWLHLADVERYVDRLLQAPSAPGKPSPYAGDPSVRMMVARHVAQRAKATFLIARLVARSLAERPEAIDVGERDWIERLPQTVGEAFEEWLDRFGTDRQRVRDLLRPLAYAQGGGMPWENVWPPAASAIADTHYGDSDVEWLLDVAGAFVVETRQAQRSAYRLFHEALAEHLRPPDREKVNQKRIVRVLRDGVPSSEGGPEWANAIDYSRQNLATHAAAADEVDGLVADPGFLIAADPTRLLRALSSTDSPTVAGVRSAYHGAFSYLHGASLAERASYIELYAQRHLVDDLAEQVQSLYQARPWRPRWTKLRADSEHFVLGRHNRFASHVATGVVNGRAIAVSGGNEDHLRFWDLDARAPVGRPPEAPELDPGAHDLSGFTFLGFTQLQGVPVAVSQDRNGNLDLWDPETGDHLATPFTDIHTYPHGAVSVTADKVFLVRGKKLWAITDFSENAPIESYLEREREPPALLRCGSKVFGFDPRGGTISGSILRDLSSGEEMGALPAANDIAGAELSGKPVVFSVHRDGTLQLRYAESLDRLAWSLSCEVGALEIVTAGVAEGRPVAAVAGADRALRIVDLANGAPIGGPIVGHTARVTSAAFGELDGRAVVVSGSDDRSVRVWDVHAGVNTPPPRPNFPGAIRAVSVSRTHEGQQAIASAGRDGCLRLMRLDDGTEIGRHAEEATLDGVAMCSAAGRTVLGAGTFEGVVVSEFANDLLQPSRRRRRSRRDGDGKPCRALQAVMVGDEECLAIGFDRTVALYNVSSGRVLSPKTGGHEGGVTALAATARHGVPLAISGGGEGGLLKWDLTAVHVVAPLVQAHSRHITAVAIADFDDQGVIVTAGGEGKMRTWDLGTMADHGVEFVGHTDWVRSIVVGSLDGVPVIVSGGDDYTVRVWTADGHLLQTIMLATAVRALAMSGSTVIVGADVGLAAIDLWG
jgi:WD40 repeat protein